MASISATAVLSAARQLRPVVIAVVAAKLAVAALLLTTVNLHASIAPTEMAGLR